MSLNNRAWEAIFIFLRARHPLTKLQCSLAAVLGNEGLIRKFPGVLDTEVGYAGGKSKNPTYNEVKMAAQTCGKHLGSIDNSRLNYPNYWIFLHNPRPHNSESSRE